MILEQAARSVLTFVNADIVLLPDFLPTIDLVSRCRDRFLLVGRRWDLDLRGELEFGGGWSQALRSSLQGGRVLT